jgi:hypothetical protein
MGDHLTAGTGASSRGIHSFPREEILRTETLWRRPKRPPYHESENRALARLVQALANSPSTILQTRVLSRANPPSRCRPIPRLGDSINIKIPQGWPLAPQVHNLKWRTGANHVQQASMLTSATFSERC